MNCSHEEILSIGTVSKPCNNNITVQPVHINIIVKDD